MFNLRPDYYAKGNITKLDLDLLAKDGINGLILDLDNTIMRPRGGFFCDVIQSWLQLAQSKNFKMIIVTNNKNEKYLKTLENALKDFNLYMIIKAQKPKKTKLLEALQYLNLPPEQVCIVGDRVLTDILGGYNISAKTALVKPLLGKDENILFKFLRKLEYLFLHPSFW